MRTAAWAWVLEKSLAAKTRVRRQPRQNCQHEVNDETLSCAYHVRMGRVFDQTLAPNPHYYEITGRAAEIARALGSPVGGAEHLFLGMLHDGGWPVSVISRLVDLSQAEAAVLRILDSPGYSPPSPHGSPSAMATCTRGVPTSPLRWAIPTSA
jgi:hypothetical protein